MKIIDLHCDTLFKLRKDGYDISKNNAHITDIGLKSGRYLAECFAIFTPPEIYGENAFLHFKEQYKIFKKMVFASKILEKAAEADYIINNSQRGKVSAILTIENAEFLNGKLERLYEVKNCSARILGVIHNGENCLGYPHCSENFPLKEFGREVIDALNNTNIIADVSHLNYGGFCDIKKLSKKPFIATHSACREICEHTRNLYDSQIKDIANSGGIVGVPFYSYFLNGTNKTEVADILNHLHYLIKIGGEDVAALGSDFDGIECKLFLKNCGEMPVLVDALIQKFGISLTEKICYKNALRVLG